MAPNTTSRARNWVFTDNQPDDDKREAYLSLVPDTARYICFQREAGDGTGHQHFQGMVCFTTQKSLTQVKALFPGCHLEVMRGTVDQAKTYCTKDDTRISGPWECGEQPQQGKRNDLAEAAALVKAGKSMAEIADQCESTVIRYHKGLQHLQLYYGPSRTWAMEVEVYWGGTGSGKTRAAFEKMPLAYWKEKGEWWDGYDSHADVLIDEFAHDVPITVLLRWLDRYPLRVPVKGGFVQFVARRIIITSNIKPDEWYPNALAEHRAALRRRFTRVVHFNPPLMQSNANAIEIE